MLSDAFVTTLNDKTDDSITWAHTKYGDTYFNMGYPTIQGRFLQQQMALANNILLAGLMHSSLNVSAQAMDTESDEYQAMSAAADGQILSAYSVSTTDQNGNFIPAELWISGGVQITVPVDEGLVPTGADEAAQGDAIIALTMIGEDGGVITVYPDSIKDGKAVFTIAAPADFAVVKKSAPLWGDTDLDGEVSILDATLIQRYLAAIDDITDLQKSIADVDGDGEVTIFDATYIQRLLAGIISEFPVERDKQ